MKKKRLYRSIDETWEDSSEPKILAKPELPQRLFVAKSRYMHNVVVDGKIQIMEVSEAMHKRIVASMTDHVGGSWHGVRSVCKTDAKRFDSSCRLSIRRLS